LWFGTEPGPEGAPLASGLGNTLNLTVSDPEPFRFSAMIGLLRTAGRAKYVLANGRRTAICGMAGLRACAKTSSRGKGPLKSGDGQ
jgi:hypothetical protein